MDQLYKFFINTQVFTVQFYIFFFTYWMLNNVTLLTALYSIDESTSAKKTLSIALIMTFFAIVVRKFIFPPYSMIIVHFFGGVLITFFYKATIIKSFIGMFFSMVLVSMGGVALTYNLVIISFLHVERFLNIPMFLFLGFLEYVFNFIYIMLVKKYPNLTLKNIFQDELGKESA